MEQHEDAHCKIENGVSKSKLLRIHHRHPARATCLCNPEHPRRAIDSYDVRMRRPAPQVFKELTRSCTDVQDVPRLRERQHLENGEAHRLDDRSPQARVIFGKRRVFRSQLRRYVHGLALQPLRLIRPEGGTRRSTMELEAADEGFLAGSAGLSDIGRRNVS